MARFASQCAQSDPCYCVICSFSSFHIFIIYYFQDSLLKITKTTKAKKKKENTDGRDGRRRKLPLDAEGDSSGKKQKAEKKELDSNGGDSSELNRSSWNSASGADPTVDSRSKPMLHFVPQINRNIRFATYTKENGRTLVVQDQPVGDGAPPAFPTFSTMASQGSLTPETVRPVNKSALPADNPVSTTESLTSSGVTATTVRISDTSLSSVAAEESKKPSWTTGEVIIVYSLPRFLTILENM